MSLAWYRSSSRTDAEYQAIIMEGELLQTLRN
jgi:hypothetical protein